jgi:hypothetical protein
MSIKLERRSDGQLWLSREGEADIAVLVRRPFPWTAPTAYVSLRNDNDEEVALINEQTPLDDESRAALDAALADVTFVFDIESIESIDTEFEIRNWKVRTRQGQFTFQMKHDRWPHKLPDGTLLIRDIESNLLRIREPHKMDKRSQNLLWSFADWG